jgi:hypothetical protein
VNVLDKETLDMRVVVVAQIDNMCADAGLEVFGRRVY